MDNGRIGMAWGLFSYPHTPLLMCSLQVGYIALERLLLYFIKDLPMHCLHGCTKLMPTVCLPGSRVHLSFAALGS